MRGNLGRALLVAWIAAAAGDSFGFRSRMLYDILIGKRRGLWGKSHDVDDSTIPTLWSNAGTASSSLRPPPPTRSDLLLEGIPLHHRGGSDVPANNSDPANNSEPWLRFFGFPKNTNRSSDRESQTTNISPREKRRRGYHQSNRTIAKPADEEKHLDSAKHNETTSSPAIEPAPGNNKTSSKTAIGAPSTMGEPPLFMAVPATTYIRRSHGNGPGSMNRPGSMSPDRIIVSPDALSRLIYRVLFMVWSWKYFFGQDKIVPVQHFVWERLNDRYTKDSLALQSVVNQPPLGIHIGLWRIFHDWKVLQRPRPTPKPLSQTFNRTVIVVPLSSSKNGELDVLFLTEVVSFLVTEYRARTFGVAKSTGQPLPLEVVLLVTSPGGSVTHYGLAAAQVQRLKQEDGISLTVCVDKIAASGGYMIASQADKLIAAPFASVGSVGVLLEGFNLNELSRSYGIRPISLKSGKHKNSLSTIGPILPADERYEIERLTRVHEAFQDLVISGRPHLAQRKDVLEGQVYFGSEALHLDLVDHIMTSHQYIMDRIAEGNRVLKIYPAKSLPKHQQGAAIPIAPHDLLPFLRTWVSNHCTPSHLAEMLMKYGPMIGFSSHVVRQIMQIFLSTPPNAQ